MLLMLVLLTRIPCGSITDLDSLLMRSGLILAVSHFLGIKFFLMGLATVITPGPKIDPVNELGHHVTGPIAESIS